MHLADGPGDAISHFFQRFPMPQLRIGTSHSAALVIAVGLGDGRIGGLGNTLFRLVKFF